MSRTFEDATRSNHDLENILYKSIIKLEHRIEHNSSYLKDPENAKQAGRLIYGMSEASRIAYKSNEIAVPIVNELKRNWDSLANTVSTNPTNVKNLLPASLRKHTATFQWLKENGVKPDLSLELIYHWAQNCVPPFVALFGNDVHI